MVRVPSRPTHRLTSTAAFATASILANVLGYVTSIALVRGLTPDDFGAIGALLSLGIIGTVPYTALQLTVSRHATDSLAQGRRLSRAHAAAAGLAVGLAVWAVFVVAAWPLSAYLNLDSPWQVVWVGFMLVPMLVCAALNGVLLGEERIGRLAASTMTSATGRVLAVILAVLWHGGIAAVLAALVLGALASCAVVYALTPSGGRERLPLLAGAHAVSRSAVVLAGYLLLTNADVPMARHHLTGPDSGTYAIAALFTKVCLWGPQFLAVVAFPRMHRAKGRSRTLWVLVMTAAFGGAIALFLVPTGSVIVGLVAGRPVPEAASLAPLFALLGTSWAVINVAVFHDIATRPTALGGWVWCCTTALIVGLALLDTPTTVASIVTWALAVSASGAVFAVVRMVRRNDERSVWDPVGMLPVDRPGESPEDR